MLARTPRKDDFSELLRIPPKPAAPCVEDMSPLIGLVLLPAMRLFGKAPHASVFRATDLERALRAAGIRIITVEWHAARGRDFRPHIVARGEP